MPNWCNNVVNIRHDDAAMIARARDAFTRGELLQEFIPCPQALMDDRATTCGGENAAECDAIRAANVAEHGFESWYNWRVAHWGTKWDVGGAIDDVNDDIDVLTLTFDSAWSPPIEAYERLEDLGFVIEAFYYEPGMAFCGTWTDGADNCIDIPSTSAEAELVIPRVIDDMFDIVNSMAMWEEEDAASE